MTGRKRRERSHGSRSGKNVRWKVLAAIIAVCATAAFLSGVLLRFDYESMVNYYLFGETNPRISAERQKELKGEFTDMLKKEFGGQ